MRCTLNNCNTIHVGNIVGLSATDRKICAETLCSVSEAVLIFTWFVFHAFTPSSLEWGNDMYFSCDICTIMASLTLFFISSVHFRRTSNLLSFHTTFYTHTNTCTHTVTHKLFITFNYLHMLYTCNKFTLLLFITHNLANKIS